MSGDIQNSSAGVVHQQPDYAALLRELSSNDQIMEKNTERLLKQFITVGGKPHEVIKSLSEGYRGYSQMANLVQYWMELTGLDSQLIHELLLNQIKTIVKSSFNPKKADSIFTQSKTVPQWLEKMIQDQEWRKLLYELAEEHKQCLMLSFAIQKISDAGYHEEIGCLTSVSNYFSVFNGVLQVSLTKILNSNLTEFEELLPQFLKLCTTSANTYLYSQSVLLQLMSISMEESLLFNPTLDSNFKQTITFRAKRIYQELETYLLQSVTPQQKFWIKVRISLSPPVPSLLSPLESFFSTRSTNPGDILKLHSIYTSSNPPPVEFIRNPILIDLLVKDLFMPGKTQINPNYISKYAYILAYIVSVKDDRMFCSITDFETKSDSQITINKEELSETNEAILIVSSLCHKSAFGSELEIVAKEFEKYVHMPIISMGVLLYIQNSLEDTKYYSSSFHSISTHIHFYLLRKIIFLHPFQHSTVFNLLVKCYELNPDLDALETLEIKRKVIEILLFLMRHGYAIPVIKKISEWAPKSDRSLIRFFLLKLTEMIAPPFSDDFVSEIFALLEVPETINAFHNVDTKRTIHSFYETCVLNSPHLKLSPKTLEQFDH